MIGSSRKRVATTSLAILFLVSSTAWASSQLGILRFENLCVFLPGIDSDGTTEERYGEGSEEGDYTTFFALVNTCNGNFLGSARGTVRNESNLPALITGQNFFCDYCTRVNGSVYLVLFGNPNSGWCAPASYVAFGQLCD